MRPKNVIKNKKMLSKLLVSAFVIFCSFTFLLFQIIGASRDHGHFVGSWQAVVAFFLAIVFVFIMSDLLVWNSGLEKANQDFHLIFGIEPDEDRVLVQKYVNATLENLRRKARTCFILHRAAWHRYEADKLGSSSELDECTKELDLAKKNFWDAVHVADNHHYVVPDNTEDPIKQLDVYG